MKLLDRYSEIINKGLTDMTIEDTYILAQIGDEVGMERAKLKLEKSERKQKIDMREANRTLVLKSEMTETTDAKGNTKMTNRYSADEYKAMIFIELEPMEIEVSLLDRSIDELNSIDKTIDRILPVIRDYLRALGYNQEA